jgi:hypothetical protein
MSNYDFFNKITLMNLIIKKVSLINKIKIQFNSRYFNYFNN